MLNRSIKYFLEIVNAKSLTAAADRLHVSPSAISRMIRKLEEDYGMDLFERRGRGMVLTEAGRIMLACVRRNLMEIEKTRIDIRDLQHIGQHTIRIASNQAFGIKLMPDLICRYQEQHPEVVFHLDLQLAKDIHRMVADGDADIGICYSMAPTRGVDVLYSRRMPILAAMRHEHQLAGKSSITLKEISQYPLGLSSGTTLRTMVDLCCLNENLTLTPAFTSNNISALQEFCRGRRDAIVLIGQQAADYMSRTGGLKSVLMSHPELHQRHAQIITMHGRKLPLSVQRFLDMLICHLNANALTGFNAETVSRPLKMHISA